MRLRKPRIDTKDIAGQRFYDLTALYIEKKGKYQGAKWRCKCDCGNECIVYGGHLRAGKRKSCGCRSRNRIRETSINLVFSLYKTKARKRNISFDLSRNEFEDYIFRTCFYCGEEPSNYLRGHESGIRKIEYTGIDRVDPSKGYEKNNCVPCCFICNRAKSDLSLNEWLSYVKRISSYQRIINGI